MSWAGGTGGGGSRNGGGDSVVVTCKTKWFLINDLILNTVAKGQGISGEFFVNVSWFRNVFLVFSNQPKKQRYFCKDFCPSLG